MANGLDAAIHTSLDLEGCSAKQHRELRHSDNTAVVLTIGRKPVEI
jgi:hypothetical protein